MSWKKANVGTFNVTPRCLILLTKKNMAKKLISLKHFTINSSKFNKKSRKSRKNSKKFCRCSNNLKIMI